MANKVLIKYVTMFCLVLTLTDHAMSWKNVPEEFMEMANVMMNNCLGKLPITKETIENARELIYPEHGTEEEKHYKCYLKCIFEEMGVWENGKVDEVKQKEAFPPHLRDKYRSNHENCNHIMDDQDECNSAYLIMECYKNNNPEIFFVL